MINDYLNLFANEQYLHTFFGVFFAGFIALFAFLGFVVVEKTKDLVEKILFNPHYINLGTTADKEYKLWMYVRTFNPEILRFFDWKKIKNLIRDELYIDGKDAGDNRRLNYEGENYKKAFYRFKNIAENFNKFFWITIILLFISLISSFCMFFFKNYYIGLIIELSANNIIFLLSLSSLFFAAKVIKSLFLYGSKKEGERLKEKIFKE